MKIYLNNTIRSIFLLLVLFTLSVNTQAIDRAPTGERIDSQSFKANFKHFKKVMFASYNDYEVGPAKVHFYLMRDSQIVYAFPDFPIASTSWSFEGVKAISFKDLNADGLKDIIIITEYVTGIGPTGMVPFRVKGVYFQDKGKFSSNKKVNVLLNREDNYQKLKTISSIKKYLKQLDLNELSK